MLITSSILWERMQCRKDRKDCRVRAGAQSLPQRPEAAAGVTGMPVSSISMYSVGIGSLAYWEKPRRSA